MNFDGTYPEKEGTGKLLPKEKPPINHQPVRVVVSYPQSEEWDGRTTKSSSMCKWLMLTILIILIIASFFLVYHFFINDILFGKETKQGKTHQNGLSDEDLKNHFLHQVFTHYNAVKKEQNYAEQLQFFKNESETLKLNNLTYFLNELNIAIPLILPQNIDIHTNIIEKLYDYTQNAKLWLEHVVKLESHLTSYDYQKTNDLLVNSDENKWTSEENEELKKLREKYTKPEIIKITDNKIEIYKTVLVFSNVVNLIPGNTSIEQVLIIASILHMDINFRRNIDLAIFAADWRFQSPVTIDLSGANAPPTNLSIKNGENGASGKDGGYFIAGGKIDLTQINVISNGGAAAAGHDGANGRNGIRDLEPSLKTNDYSFSLNDFQCCIPNDNATVNSANEVVQLFRVYNERACGEEGLQGGKPGYPGRGGEIIFFIPKKKPTRGRNGAEAAHGLDGINGESATASCYYNMYKIQPPPGTEHVIKTKWTPITTKICNSATLLPLRKNILNTGKERFQAKKNLTQLILAFESFTKKARDNLEHENSNELFLILENIESNSVIMDFSSPISLFNEFNEIEKKYTKIEIFRSFARKVSHFLNKAPNDENKNALEYLQVAIWTKMSVIHSIIGGYYIVDIDVYLNQLLSTAKRLDVDTLKVSTFDDQLKTELFGKFEKIQTHLAPINNLTCEPNNVSDNDRRIKCLLSMLSNIVTNFSQILSKQIFEGSSEMINLHKKIIRDHIEEYKKNEYISDLPKNGTTCVDMPIEVCKELNRSKSFEKMERTLFKSFEKLEQIDFLLGMGHVVKIILRQVHETRAFSPKIYILIRDFRDATEDFSVLLKNSFLVLLDKQVQTKLESGLQIVHKKSLLEKVSLTKQRIFQSLLLDQYMRALRAYQQWVFPFTDTVEVIAPGAKKSEIINGIQAIKDARLSYVSTIKRRDSQIIKAEFRIASNEPFYTWNNKDYHSVISDLLNGRVVNLRADLFGSNHIVNKQAIKFQTAELRLTGVPQDVLRDYNVEMTHSGYSNYMYNGTALTIVGPEIILFHSFDHNRHSGEPRKQNKAYEKIKNGEIMLSPYTSWTFQLKPNSLSGFSNLQKYVDSTDVHLVGTGSYVQMT